MEKSDEFSKNVKSGKGLLISGILIFVISIVVGLFVTYAILDEEAIDFKNVSAANDYSKIEILGVTDYFATLEESGVTQKMYIVFTDENVFIANIDANTFSKLSDLYDYTYSEDEDAIAPDPVTIYGRAKSIPTEVYDYAKEYIFGDEEVSDYEFKSVIGNYYLDTYESPSSDVVYIVIIFGILAVIGLALVIVQFIRNNKTKKYLENYKEEIDKIKSDIDSGSAIHNKICHVYLTNKYLVNYAAGLKLIELQDVVWVYPYEYRRNGIVTQKSVYVITDNGKANVVATVSAWGRKNKIAYEEFYQELMNKVPNALHGYSKENKEKAKEMYKK